MTAEVLREAAAAMRQRANYAPVPPGPWEKEFTDVIRTDVPLGSPGYLIAETGSLSEAAHIASWHPAVALAVADWLDSAASMGDLEDEPIYDAALAVARAFLGEGASGE